METSVHADNCGRRELLPKAVGAGIQLIVVGLMDFFLTKGTEGDGASAWVLSGYKSVNLAQPCG